MFTKYRNFFILTYSIQSMQRKKENSQRRISMLCLEKKVKLTSRLREFNKCIVLRFIIKKFAYLSSYTLLLIVDTSIHKSTFVDHRVHHFIAGALVCSKCFFMFVAKKSVFIFNYIYGKSVNI